MIILTFFSKTSFVSKIFRTFADAICSYGKETLIVGRSRWVGHYILKGVTDALFLIVLNFHNHNAEQKQCWGDCHGVCISDSVVCCEDRVSSMHTLRCTIYSKVGVSLSVFQQRLWKAKNGKQADASTHVFRL